MTTGGEAPKGGLGWADTSGVPTAHILRSSFSQPSLTSSTTVSLSAPSPNSTGDHGLARPLEILGA